VWTFCLGKECLTIIKEIFVSQTESYDCGTKITIAFGHNGFYAVFSGLEYFSASVEPINCPSPKITQNLNNILPIAFVTK
jgi:hypothetical protein